MVIDVREIPRKNYFILALLVSMTVVIVIAFVNFYNNRHRQTSEIYNFLPEVTLEDLDVYLSERDNPKQAKKLKNKIIKLNLLDSFVYLDSNNVDDDFIKTFSERYGYTIERKYPAVIIMSSKRVSKVYLDSNIADVNFEELK